MKKYLVHKAAALVGLAVSLGACAPSVSFSDLTRPGYNMNPLPAVSLDPPYVNSPYSFGPQQPCLISNYACTPQLQLQWAEIYQR